MNNILFVAIISSCILASCKHLETKKGCSQVLFTLNQTTSLDINLIRSSCTTNPINNNMLFIKLTDTSSYPSSELSELRAEFIVSMLPEIELIPEVINITTYYTKYSNEYEINILATEVSSIKRSWNENPRKYLVVEYMMKSFISDDWALMEALNDSLSPPFVNYNSHSVIDKIILASLESNHFSIEPSAADNLALLYGIVRIYSEETAKKMEPLFRVIEYPNYLDVKYVKSRFKHTNSLNKLPN